MEIRKRNTDLGWDLYRLPVNPRGGNSQLPSGPLGRPPGALLGKGLPSVLWQAEGQGSVSLAGLQSRPSKADGEGAGWRFGGLSLRMEGQSKEFKLESVRPGVCFKTVVTMN